MDDNNMSRAGQEHALGLLTATGAMNPDHPMLQRAQEALRRQLEAKRLRVEGELREKQNALTKTKKQREEVGVELYGYQQNLAKLQMSLEKAQESYQALSDQRVRAELELSQLKKTLESQQSITKQESQRSEAVQRELDRLGATLKQIESYNESMKGEIAVTRRAAYAAEEAVQKLEKEKQQQDYLIDDLQETMKSLQQQLDVYTAQLTAQQRETRAAKETLADAESEMEGVHFEKKQLLAQWRGVVNAIQRRDEALAAIQDSIRQQQQQELSIDAETQGYKKDINKEQIQNEQLSGLVRKLQGETEFVLKQAQSSMEKQERLGAQLSKLTKSLEQTEEKVRRAAVEQKAVDSEADTVERAVQHVFQDIRLLESDMLRTLSEQTSAEKSTSKTAADIKGLRAAAIAEELRIAEVQNEIARVAVDVLNTQGHNERLQQALLMLDVELRDKDAAIAKCELEIKRKADEIERKTRETDNLNRKLEQIVAAQPEAVNTGPLEATIHNLSRDIEQKGKDGQDLQRRWILRQTELVALQAENNGLTEALSRHRAEVTVLQQKRRRAERALAQQVAETKALRAASNRLQVDLGRVNALIAQNAGLKAVLHEEQLQLEGRALAELRELEETSAAVASAIQEAQLAKRALLDDLIEAERQIMLAERKIQLEKEMQEMLDPSVGEGVVQAMRKEVHRMELRQQELLRTQERLMQELEKALSKHELIGVKALAQKTKGSGSPGGSGRSSPSSGRSGASSPSQGQSSRQVTELKRSIKDTEAESIATQQRLQQLQEARVQLEAQKGEALQTWHKLQQQQAESRTATADTQAKKYQALLTTSQLQQITKYYEEAAAGKYKRQVDPATATGPAVTQVQQELAKATDKQDKLVQLIRVLQEQAPMLHEELDRVAAHAAAASSWLRSSNASDGVAAC